MYSHHRCDLVGAVVTATDDERVRFNFDFTKGGIHAGKSPLISELPTVSMRTLLHAVKAPRAIGRVKSLTNDFCPLDDCSR